MAYTYADHLDAFPEIASRENLDAIEDLRSKKGKPIVKIVHTGSEPAPFSVDVPGPSAKAVLDTGWSVLRR